MDLKYTILSLSMTRTQRVQSYKPQWKKVKLEGNEGIKEGIMQAIKQTFKIESVEKFT